ncbi:MAG TPA: SCO family protein [Vicinamibacterales bacterium]|nr:SCO family protein [Vicinamibacterales bacterium]
MQSSSLVWAFLLLASVPASAQWVRQQQDPPPPQIIRQVGIDQRLNAQVPLDLTFMDEHGRGVALRQFFGKRPVILALVYYECPMLCNQVLNGLTQSLRVMSLNAGRDYDVVAVSFDPAEGPKLSSAKKLAYVSKYGREGSAGGWHFLTGRQESIAALTRAVGFRYRWDDRSDQWAHGAGVVVLTPTGVVSRYFYGIEYGVRDLRLGLVEASANRIGGLADQLMLLCYQYDPLSGHYGVIALNSIRAAGIVTIVALGTFIGVMLRRERRSALRHV